MSRARRSAALAALLLTAILPGAAAAHTRSVSYSSWTLDGAGNASVVVRVPRIELTRLGTVDASGAEDAVLARYLEEHLRLLAAGEPCALADGPWPRPAAEGWIAVSWRVACGDRRPLVVESAVLQPEAPSHLHFARVALPDGRVRERVLSSNAWRWTLATADAQDPAAEAPGDDLPRYIGLGVDHILSGWDHLAFVLALLLLAGTLGEVARLVTGFTVAHSVTLALAVLGVVRPAPGAVEAVVGFSVALVGAENAWVLAGRHRRLPPVVVGGLLALAALAMAGVGRLAAVTLIGLALFSACHFALLARSQRPAGLRTALAFAFGLVHGLGFAGVLAELHLPTARLVPALFGFNLGVELGQLCIVALAWPLLAALARASQGRLHRATADLASAGICGLGLFWFVTRIFA
jgi:hypothetical protein